MIKFDLNYDKYKNRKLNIYKQKKIYLKFI
jgi:hypothetical protein